ncbi:MAG: hydantoinase B/oxoprolinase family protein [Nitrospinota bacterium]|nr:MAG: hydantoinase B/oxoprolinase family protein [Nitrospinota bacterium]
MLLLRYVEKGDAPVLRDPITAEVVSNYLLSVADQVNETIVRCSFNPNIKERRDCSAVLLDGRGPVVAQPEHNPAHLGSLMYMGEEVLQKYGDAVYPGDVFIHNDPYTRGSSHLNDFTLITPIFHQGELMFFAVNTAHHVDVGGRVPGSTAPDSQSLFEEGIQIPLVRLMHKGKLNQDLLQVICWNCRDPAEREADIKGQIAANEIAREPLERLCARYGNARLRTILDDILAYSRQRAYQIIQELPDGRYTATSYLDDDGLGGAPVPITVTACIEGHRLTFDFTGSGPQARGAFNASETILKASVYWAFKAMLDPDMPATSGFFDALTIVAPEGSIVNPRPGAAVGVRVDTAQKIADAVIRALNQALPPERRVAGSHAVNSGLIFSGYDPFRQRSFAFIETFGGGGGARAGKDGLDGIHVYMVNPSNLPIEVLEREYPLRVERYGLVVDSCGPGQFRGGLGIRRDVRVLADEIFVTTRSESQRQGAWGIEGGGSGRPAYTCKNPGTPQEERLPGKRSQIPLRKGDVVSLQTPGGGGVGLPVHRKPEQVWNDVLDGIISPAFAQTVYGISPPLS